MWDRRKSGEQVALYIRALVFEGELKPGERIPQDELASTLGVSRLPVREAIIASVGIAPARDRYKVFIIDEVHMLSGAAFNALLKTLEEPPPRVVFIMATTERHKVP